MFITLEGGEGAGKSTQMRLLAESLMAEGYRVVTTREPGGSAGAEAVRHVLLSGAAEDFGVRMEAILFAAARGDHVEQLIRPSVEAGSVVLCDRFIDSTRVYQGVTGNLDPAFIDVLERIAVNGMIPDLTIVIDVPANIGLERAATRAAGGVNSCGTSSPDRFEKETVNIHEKRREAFLELADRMAPRCRVVSGAQTNDMVARDVLDLVRSVLEARSSSMTGQAPTS